MTVRDEEMYTTLDVSRTSPALAGSFQEGESTTLPSAVIDNALPRTWDGRFAYVVSQVGSPPVLTSLAAAVTASVLSTSRAWAWAGVYVSIAILTPLLYLVWLVRRGQVTDLDVQLRRQRIGPLVFTSVCAGVAWLVLVLGAAPSLMVTLGSAVLLEMVVIFAITLCWKISVHSAAAAGVSTLVWSLLGTPLPLLIAVPLIAWSRVRLGRHTLAQTIAGALLGTAVFTTAFFLIGGW